MSLIPGRGTKTVVTYGCESWVIKKAECQRINPFELCCWRRLLRVLWIARRSNHSILKEIYPEYSSEGLMLKLKLQYSGLLMWRADSLEKTLMLGNIEAGREGGDRGWDGWMASPARWTWVLASSRRWWKTGKPGMLQSMGLQSQTRLNDSKTLRWETTSQIYSPPILTSAVLFRSLSPHPYRSRVCVLCANSLQSCLTLCNPLDCSPPGSSVHVDSPGRNTGVGCHALLQGVFSTQGSNSDLPHCRWFFMVWATREAQEYWSG